MYIYIYERKDGGLKGGVGTVCVDMAGVLCILLGVEQREWRVKIG